MASKKKATSKAAAPKLSPALAEVAARVRAIDWEKVSGGSAKGFADQFERWLAGDTKALDKIAAVHVARPIGGLSARDFEATQPAFSRMNKWKAIAGGLDAILALFAHERALVRPTRPSWRPGSGGRTPRVSSPRWRGSSRTASPSCARACGSPSGCTALRSNLRRTSRTRASRCASPP
jgi:hypothetical protein